MYSPYAKKCYKKVYPLLGSLPLPNATYNTMKSPRLADDKTHVIIFTTNIFYINIHLNFKAWMLADEVLDEGGLNVWAAAHLQKSEAAGLRFLPHPPQGAAAHTKNMRAFCLARGGKIIKTKKLFSM